MGACRKLDGSMCPSFMATRDEEHSTRGRANLLRAALSGRMPDGAEGSITDQRLHQASTCAWNARRARRNVSPAWTWPS